MLKHSQEYTLRNVTKFGDHLRRALSIKVYSTFVENFKQTIYLLNAKKIYDQSDLVRSQFGQYRRYQKKMIGHRIILLFGLTPSDLVSQLCISPANCRHLRP